MVWLCKNGHKRKKMKIDKNLCKCKICGEPMHWFEEMMKEKGD